MTVSAGVTIATTVMTVKVKQLGLAAYIKMSGAKLVRVEDRFFVIETDVPLEEWRLRYNDSCCMRHDSLVCEMRNFLR